MGQKNHAIYQNEELISHEIQTRKQFSQVKSKILQNLQENTCARFSFEIRLQAYSCQWWLEGSRDAAGVGPTALLNFFCNLSNIWVEIWNPGSDMKTILHGRLSDRFLEMENNIRRKKLHRINQNSNLQFVYILISQFKKLTTKTWT